MTKSSGKTTFPEDFFDCAKRLHHDYLPLHPKTNGSMAEW